MENVSNLIAPRVFVNIENKTTRIKVGGFCYEINKFTWNYNMGNIIFVALYHSLSFGMKCLRK